MIGKTLGPYAVLDRLGEGGMGAVYRARDTKLNRDVAIKILPDVFSVDPDRLARFTREAQTLAALNHPNIAHVYGVEDSSSSGSGPVRALVMELVQGEDLSAIIARGPLPLDDALAVARQIAEGLEAAHERGIVHRDLKPGNIRITPEGTVKVLDFGLAKAVDPGSSSGPALEHSPTFTSPAMMTGVGVILGTAAYMSPEQARGKAVDRRADIWAFGVVLYEMLAGRRLFEGAEVTDVLASVLRQDVDWSALPPATPARLRRLLERCLDRDPRQRLRDIGEARVEIGRIERGETDAVNRPPSAPARSGGDRRLALVAAAALAAGVVVTLAGLRLFERPERGRPMFLDVAAPPGYSVDVGSALSPDGAQLAFTVADRQGRSHLAIRALSTGDTRIVPDSDDAEAPFWSPDADKLGYFVTDRLRRFDLSTSRSRVVCDARGARRAGAWNSAGVIVFASEAGVPVMKVSADGGGPIPLERAHGFRPFFLPDGRHFLLSRWHSGAAGPDGAGLGVVDVETGDVVELRQEGVEPKYAEGHLLFALRGQLMAQPFDAGRLQLSGAPRPIADIGRHPGSTGANFTVAGSTIAFVQPSQSIRTLAWFTRAGARTPIGDAADWRNPALSPDDSQAAVQRYDTVENQADIWLIDAARGTGRMFVSGASERIGMPFWSPDGQAVRFGRRTGLMEKPTDGAPERAAENAQATSDDQRSRGFATGVTGDGGAIGFVLIGGNREIIYFTSSGERKFFARSPANETQPAVSPDGRWIAYVSDSGGYDVERLIFVDAFPDGGHRVKVSGELPGVQPRWRSDGRELFYLGVDGRLMSVAVETSAAGIRFGPPQPLVQTALGPEAGLGTRASYDASRDGSRFLIAEPQEGSRLPARSAGPAIRVVLNWTSAPQRK